MQTKKYNIFSIQFLHECAFSLFCPKICEMPFSPKAMFESQNCSARKTKLLSAIFPNLLTYSRKNGMIFMRNFHNSLANQEVEAMRNTVALVSARFAKPGQPFESVALPHTWNALDGQDGGMDYFRGACTYEIALPPPTEGKRQFIEFAAANHEAEVFLNGVRLGAHRGGFSTFRFELTAHMRHADNVLTVKVDNDAPDTYPQNADFTFFGGSTGPYPSSKLRRRTSIC